MKKINSILIILALMSSMMAISSGCGEKRNITDISKPQIATPKVIRLAWWGSQERHDITLKVIEMYKQKVGNIDFDVQYSPFQEYWKEMATLAAANNLPDVFQHDYSYLRQWSEKELLEDLTPYIQLKKIDTSNIEENYIAGGKVNNRIYGVNLAVNTLAFIYNPVVFQKAGIPVPNGESTWDAMADNIIKVYRNTGMQCGIFMKDDPKFLLEYMLREKGLSMYNHDGTALGFSDVKVAKDMFNMMLRLVKSGAMLNPRSTAVDITGKVSNLAKGITFLDITWSNNFLPISNHATTPLALAMLPKDPSAVRNGLYLKPSMFFSVAKLSENKEEAVKFINYFINDIEANKVLGLERGVPVSSEIRNILKSDSQGVNKQAIEYIELVEKNSSSIDAPDPSRSGEVTKLLKTIWDRILVEELSIEEGAIMFIENANEILGKNAESRKVVD